MLAGREYYKRSVEGFYRLEHFDLKDMFGRRQKPKLRILIITDRISQEEKDIKVLKFYFLNEGRAIAKYYGFWCRFKENIEIIATPEVSMKNITDMNDGKPTISFENNVSVIHPNNIQIYLGSMQYKRVNKNEKIQRELRYYCNGMTTESLKFEFE